MRVVHINVRVDRGGAARVARTLHHELLAAGHQSVYLYGYERRGGASREPGEGIVRIGSRSRSAANLFSHRLLGVDPLRPRPRSRDLIRALLADCDVVHLHCIHSHLASYRWLLREIAEADLGVVWTLHDLWVATGRCALPYGCPRLQSGCGHCPTRHAYPSGWFDRTSAEAIAKRQLVGSLSPTFVACSDWLAKVARSIFPEFDTRVVRNAVAPEFLASRPVRRRASAPLKLLAVGEDLSDRAKHDHALLQEVADLPGVELVTAGARSPIRARSVTNLGPVPLSRMPAVYAQADALLFTSVVDNFPTVVLEAACAGVPTLALPSFGAAEALAFVGQRPTMGRDDLVTRLRRGEIGAVDTAAAHNACAPRTMAEKYLEVYHAARERLDVAL